MAVLRAARDIEGRTGQESFHSQAHAIIKWQYGNKWIYLKRWNMDWLFQELAPQYGSLEGC